MASFYQLSTCSTCRRILTALGDPPELEVIDIKTTPLREEELDRMAQLAGSYEALFNRRARKYRAEGLAERTLTETDYRELILQEYTFLKRPVLLTGDQIFVGNTQKTVDAARQALPH